MKLLVFAHTPPPHHGQSYMVKLMLDGFGGDCRRGRRNDECKRMNDELQTAAPSIQNSEFPIECYHVNCRVSEKMEDIGRIRPGKIWLLLRCCFGAIWSRFRYGVTSFYYVPAPGGRAALYRDWIVMLLCRPFFKKIIFHWHAVSLGDWLHREGTCFEKLFTHWLLDRPALSIVLTIPNMRDALWFKSKAVAIVPNGIPDPCPDFEEKILPLRQARLIAREKLLRNEPLADEERAAAGGTPEIFRVLYLAHCTRKKGLFDTLEAVALANSQPSPSFHDLSGRSFTIHLTVAGAFLYTPEEYEFQLRIRDRDLEGCVTYAGFVAGAEKAGLLQASDCLCFPTYYEAEGQPVCLIEAMAFGLPIVTTRWRAIPEILPAGYPGFVSSQAPAEIARVLRLFFANESAVLLRSRFVNRFTEARHIQAMKVALANL